MKTGTPLLNLRVLANGRYLLTLIISSIITISLYSGAFLIPVFLQRIQDVFGSFSIAIFTSLLSTFGTQEAAVLIR